MEFSIFNSSETAALLGVSQKTLARWRVLGQGPKFLQVGVRSVRYTGRSLNEYLDSTIREMVEYVRPAKVSN